MDIANARILIRKINSLFKSVDQDDAQLSAIERDLMLSYLRQLYALFLEEQEQSAPQKTAPTPEPVIQAPPVIRQTPPPPPPPPAPEPQAPVYTPPPPIQEEPAPPPPKPAPAQVSDGTSMEQLFAFKKATELSERLSESPLTDLPKAMSINDRLLYINELFGRDRSALEDSLTVLNRFDNFAAAKSFLISLAEQYQWAQEDRIEIAQNFIKLVRRRYPV